MGLILHPNYSLIHDDCLNAMKDINDKSVDATFYKNMETRFNLFWEGWAIENL